MYPGNHVWKIGIVAELPYIDNPVQKADLRYVSSFISAPQLDISITQRGGTLIVNADHKAIFLIKLLMMSVAKMTMGQNILMSWRVAHPVFGSENASPIR